MKKMNNKVLLFAMMICMILTSLPMSVLAYTTDTGDTWYGEVDGNTQHQATTIQTNAITAMENRALYFWRIEIDDYGEGSYFYRQKENTPNDDRLEIMYGQRYRGIPYEMKNYETGLGHEGCREHWWASASAVQGAVEEMINNDCEYAKGTDCSSSACYAWRSAINGNNRSIGVLMSTNNCINGTYHTAYTSKKIIWDGVDPEPSTQTPIPGRTAYGNYVDRVGQYGQYASISPLSDMTDVTIGKLTKSDNYQSGGNIYNRVYKKMQAGDFLVYRKVNGNGETVAHTMLVKKVVIVYNNGIDINNSYVVTDEQTSIMRSCNNAAYNYNYMTTWRLGYDGSDGVKYTFSQLCSLCYLPYRYNGQSATMVSGLIPEQVSETCINVKWHPQDRSFCSGYILKYSADPSFKDCETLIINDPTKNECILKDLEKGEKYYIKMCAFYNTKQDRDYSGYNNWVSVDLSDGSLYRKNAPDPTKVTQQEYKQYVYDDISIENEITDDDIE